jgi:hypothetical protein
MTGTTGSVGGAANANGADQRPWLRPGQAEINGFNLALSGAARAEADKDRGGIKDKPEGGKDSPIGDHAAIADDGKPSTLASEGARQPDAANIVPQEVLKKILQRRAEPEQRKTPPSPPDQTQTGQTPEAKPPSPNPTPKTSAFALGVKADLSFLATNDAFNQYLGPAQNANAPRGWGVALTCEGLGRWTLAPNAKLELFARAGLSEFPKVSSADTTNWGVGVRFEGKLSKPKLPDLTYGAEYQRLHTYRGTRLYTSHDLNGTGSFDVKVAQGTILKPSLAVGVRIPDKEVLASVDTRGFERFVFSPKLDMEHKLSDWVSFVGTGSVSWSYFTNGANDGRRDIVTSARAAIKFERYLTFAGEFSHRNSPRGGYNSFTASIKVSIERLFKK